jgi:hypothetical protein
MIEREPLFSLLHATARLPDGWRKAHDEWMAEADDTSAIQYVLCVDEQDTGKLPTDFCAPWEEGTEGIEVVYCPTPNGPSGAAAAWNYAAKHATGKFLITVSDDWMPCKHWDTELKNVIPNFNGDYVVEISVGGDADSRRLLPFSLLTKARYDRFGYIFHPDYYGVLADDEFTYVARRDNAVIDARHLFMPHQHFTTGHSKLDAIYERQNSGRAFAIGQEVFARRKAEGFPI